MKRINIKEKIKEYFLDYPTAKLRVRGIEKVLKVPLPSVIRYCKELKDENILDIEKIGNVSLYKANKSHESYLLEKTLHNIKKIHESGILDKLKEEFSNPPIILFGSFSKGEDTEKSDIDLFIETPSKKEINLEKYEKILKRNIQIFKNKSLKEISNPQLSNNIINGIKLNNYVEVFK